MENLKIRNRARTRDVRMWELAEKMGYSANYFSVKMRHAFSKEDTERALQYIDEIAASRKANA